MTLMRHLAVAVAILLFAAPAAIHAGDLRRAADARRYGNVPLAANPVPFEFYFAPLDIDRDSNLLVLHFDFFGVPWREFGNGDPLPAAWVAEMDEISAVADSMGLPVFLALTPLSGNRNALGPQATGETSLVLDESFGQTCEVLSGRSDWAELQVAYRAYVEWMIDRFRPRWVALSIEVNMYQVLCPASWADLERLLNEVYDEQKIRRPELPLFHTYQIDFLWEVNDSTARCFGFATNCVDENLAAIANLKTDLFAMSSYPIVPFTNNGRRLPEDWFSIFAEKTGLPVAIAETGYQFYPVEFEHPTDPSLCFTALETSGEDQLWWMTRILADAETLQMPLVVWWGNRDYLPQEASASCHCQGTSEWCAFMNLLPPDVSLLFRFFASMGLREFDGAPRAILGPWKDAVNETRPPRRRPVRRR